METEIQQVRVGRDLSRHPATVGHLRSCDTCTALVGLALFYARPGIRVTSHETPGHPTIVVRHVAGLHWVLRGESLAAVTEAEAEAVRLADGLAVEALTPEAPPVRLVECRGGFKVLEGTEEVDRARNPHRLQEALRLAEAWFPQELWGS